MLTLRSAHTLAPIGASLLHTSRISSPSSLLVLQRQFHAPATRCQEVQGSSKDKVVPSNVPEDVLKDKFEPGWSMTHARYTEDGEYAKPCEQTLFCSRNLTSAYTLVRIHQT